VGGAGGGWVGGGGSGGGTGGLGSNICYQAAQKMSTCTGEPLEGSGSEVPCEGETACSSQCIMEASCDELKSAISGEAPYTTFIECLSACAGRA
jgi:hypothetical protein